MTLLSFVVCEDGAEYTERFARFLGGEFRFLRAGCFAEALPLCAGAVGLLLDQDFRRTPPERLVDESGAPPADPRRAAEVQGILVLRALRRAGIGLPALLFADLDDPGREQALERELAPLEVVPGAEGLPHIARRLRRAAAAR